jgi:hypothetical protein
VVPLQSSVDSLARPRLAASQDEQWFLAEGVLSAVCLLVRLLSCEEARPLAGLDLFIVLLSHDVGLQVELARLYVGYSISSRQQLPDDIVHGIVRSVEDVDRSFFCEALS